MLRVCLYMGRKVQMASKVLQVADAKKVSNARYSDHNIPNNSDQIDLYCLDL